LLRITGKKIRYFIYNSALLTEIDRFASDSAINAMSSKARRSMPEARTQGRIIYEIG
jgi:type III restriction enzyme